MTAKGKRLSEYEKTHVHRDSNNEVVEILCQGCKQWLPPTKYHKASGNRLTQKQKHCRECSSIMAQNRVRVRESKAELPRCTQATLRKRRGEYLGNFDFHAYLLSSIYERPVRDVIGWRIPTRDSLRILGIGVIDPFVDLAIDDEYNGVVYIPQDAAERSDLATINRANILKADCVVANLYHWFDRKNSDLAVKDFQVPYELGIALEHDKPIIALIDDEDIYPAIDRISVLGYRTESYHNAMIGVLAVKKGVRGQSCIHQFVQENAYSLLER